MSSKKVLFLINKFSVGGAERMFVKEINGIEGAFAGTLYKEGDNSLSPLLNKELVCFDFEKMTDKGGMKRVMDFCSTNNIGVIYSTLEEANVVSRLINKKNKKIRVVTREANVAKNKSFKFKLLDFFLNKYANAIVAVSNGVKASLTFYQPFYKNKFTVLENAVELQNNLPDRKCISGEAKILMVGSLTKQKNYLEVVSALKNILSDKIILNIVGEGNLRSEIETLVKEENLSSRVNLLGFLDKEELYKVYKESNVFVLGSLWEGFPNVVLEAMSFGLPVISTPVAGSVDVIKNGKNGFLSKLDDLSERVHYVVTDCEIREKMAIESISTAEKYGINSHIANLKEILEIK